MNPDLKLIRRQGPAQDFHFSMRSLILWYQKVVSHFLNQFSIKFYIEIAVDKFQFLYCVIGTKIVKHFRVIL